VVFAREVAEELFAMMWELWDISPYIYSISIPIH